MGTVHIKKFTQTAAKDPLSLSYRARIPFGETKTHGELARAQENPGAARAVGQGCNANPLTLIVPRYRVVGSSGLGGFAGGCEGAS